MKRMYVICKKLNSSRGASIFFGLLMMLIVALVSAVLLSAALISAKSKKDDFNNQQAFLTVSSAAKLIREQIDGRSMESSTTTIYRNDIEVGAPNVVFTHEPGGSFSNLLLDAVEYINVHGFAYVSDTLAVEAEGHEKVDMQFRMDTEYNIVISFTMQDRDDRISPRLELILKNIAQKEPDTDRVERPNGEVITVETKSAEWKFEEIR